ncbi:hypothetical protein BH09MYX1_BH09MYX1_35580 [soil metagenome]
MIPDLVAEARPRKPVLPPFAETLAAPAVATWRARMVNEHGSAAVFEALAIQMRVAEFSDALVAECATFAEEERTHGILCGAVVEALGGEARADALVQPALPEHRATSRRVAVLRNFISVSCMSETVAVALIGAEKMEMEEADSPLVALLSRIHADEVGHARFGWRLLEQTAPHLSPEELAELRRYVAVALAHLRTHELAHLPNDVGFDGGQALGLCSGQDARLLFEETVQKVIVPGLERILGAGLLE